MTFPAALRRASARIQRPLIFIVYSWLSVASIALVSLALFLSSAVSGPYAMDITFDLTPESPRFDQRQADDTKDNQNIRCTDETPVIDDGTGWVRCRFIAHEIADAQQYLEQQGLQTGASFRNVRISPSNGSTGFYLASSLVTASLTFLLIRYCNWRPRAERDRLRKLGWRALPILLAPASISIALAALIQLTFKSSATSPVIPAFNLSEQIALVIAGAVIAPLIEELLHRGWVFHLLRKAGGAIFASVVGTGLFVLCHVATEFWTVGPQRLVMLVVMSASLYAIRVRFDSILLCIAAHALFNGLVVATWLYMAA